MLKHEDIKLGVNGLSYVGLPLAVEFSKKRPVLGFDISAECIEKLRAGRDRTMEVEAHELQEAGFLRYAVYLAALAECNVFIVIVPTPIDPHKRPDLTPLIKASESIDKAFKSGNIVIYESTVYPGAKEHRVTNIRKVTACSTPDAAAWWIRFIVKSCRRKRTRPLAFVSARPTKSSRTPSAT
jgi:UDP-N-acetyl-D-galactosamine dehydrogenase